MSFTLPARRAVRRPAPAGPSAWRAAVLALATALVLGLAAPQAQALSLGRVTVQSALGEPLRAEIDIPQITADEVLNLRTALGSPETFRAAGMERSAALADLQISLQQRPNGSYFLRLASDRAVNEPFIDLILEASGPTGRIVREYTLLFDPPSLRQSGPSAPPVPIAAQVAPAAPSQAADAPPPAAAPPAAAAPATAPAAAPPPAAPAASAPARSASVPAPQRRVTVQSGQTASAIAAAAKPSTVSLDQMLVSLLRANPDAFIGGNVNRLKAGAVLELPDEAQAAAIDLAEARQTVVAQSKDFNEFKQRLAAGVSERPATGGTAPPGRADTGQVQARVEDKKPAPATPDRLTLSKGAIEERARDGKASEDRIARERAEREAVSRAAELDRNIAELKRLGSESATLATPPSAATASAASSAPGNTTGIPVPAALPTPGAAAGTASAAASAAAVAAASSPASAVTSATPANDDTGLMDLLANPMLPVAVGGVLALLLGLALYRRQQARRATADPDADAAGNTLAPDSFFGGSGGQRIDTSEAGNSMLYSPSQIDAAGDVDPVAEADVYLAYGRDLQAEEILREALHATPQRVAIHAKLLEILARRHDVDAFEAIARDAHALTGGTGPHWTQIASQGLELDPGNPLYSGAGVTAPTDMRQTSAPPAMAQAPDPAPVPAPTLPAGLDLDVASFQPRPAPPPAAEAKGSPFDFSDLEPGPAPAARADSNALDFDLAGLSLDLQDPASGGPGSADALATKLSLAEEFQAIGDVDGARSLVQEVLAEADGDLRGRAQRLLAELG